jgi:hypothetical protein
MHADDALIMALLFADEQALSRSESVPMPRYISVHEDDARATPGSRTSRPPMSGLSLRMFMFDCPFSKQVRAVVHRVQFTDRATPKALGKARFFRHQALCAQFANVRGPAGLVLRQDMRDGGASLP